ncbi:maf protein [Dinoroseobacter shibae DFL 12 = DSM 16493]|uniref:dTTP/UTP pyrophosphatase n=1 Tax=Dinoroseobacter shibae (strain DSM 16493 / NCIMB 14021 / DFL 12) TaxID=398580 RepID=A8LS18_DINSH|nr:MULTISPECIES: Maf family protein [Dinoroseobacter]ABV92725.1 maf protein [Dinoroseobacter shibae DFL 12 = DSM 16493]MDD9715799.1 Maf family protein [Dinoroseobacter sp. PD6]
MPPGPRFILGSGSPRRQELLAQIGYVPDAIRAADIDETPHPGERPLAYVRRMAVEKSAALELAENEVLLTADTTVCVGLRILGKPEDAEEARAFLRLMSGRRHRVITAIAVRTSTRTLARDVSTTLRMLPLTDADIDAYLASGEWRGKAGGYGIQGIAGAFIPWISGSYTAVVGLPLAETAASLRSAGVTRQAG